MQHTYEITETDGGWIANVYKDNFILIHQPHHPQQNFEEDGPFWKNKESAEAWAKDTVDHLNGVVEFVSTVNDQPPAELPNLSDEQLMQNIKVGVANLLGTHAHKIVINTDGE